MDYNKIDQSLNRKLEKIDLNTESVSGRKPITNYDKYFYLAEVPYKDALVEARVIQAWERLQGVYKGVYLDTLGGPWLLFKIEDILEGDSQGLICPGTVILGRWDNKKKVYSAYIEKEDPEEMDREILAISSLTGVSEREIVRGFYG